ncbi:MAG: hypothetical protein E6H10_16195 [Bacteroidetes bacterium]|nr:MAG: hypothetical protein E6H10_16195 [Bacteroidota bacterium]
MAKYLGDRPNVSPAFVVNQETLFTSDDEATTPSSQLEGEDADSNAAAPLKAAEGEEDAFLTGTRHKGKKKRKVRDANEGSTKILEALKEHWEEEKDTTEQTQMEEKEANTQPLAELKVNNQIGRELVEIFKRFVENN